MLNLKFKISNSKPKLSEIYLSESYISKNPKNYEDIILDQINMANLIDKKHIKLESAWLNLINFINSNNFHFYKTLALKKKTPKFSKWLENNDRPLENICIIIHDENLKINNSICFFIDIEKNNESHYDYFLKRIEFFNWSLIMDNIEKINLDKIVYDECNYTNHERKLLFEYEPVFRNDDYQEDPLLFKEWIAYLEHLSKHFNNKKHLDESNYVINIKNNNIILSKYKFNLKHDKYILFHNEIGQEVKNDNFYASNDKETDLIKELSTYINECKTKIGQCDELINILEKDIDINKKNLYKLNEDHSSVSKIYFDNEGQKECLVKQIIKLKNEGKNTNKELGEIKELGEMLDSNELDLKKIHDNIMAISLKKKNIEDELKKINFDLDQKEKEKLEYYKWIKLYESLIEFCNENNFKYFYILSISQVDNNALIFPELNNNNWKIYSFKNNDYGTKAIINRFNNAFKNIERGYYKNPFFYLGLRNSSFFNDIKYINEIDSFIIEKYKLNNKQLNAAKKAINTNSFFYLQGPPGTGKTQTISAIAEWIVNNKMNLIMTSSTHEAIENFFDRLSESNNDNPNLVALKFRTNINNEINDEKYSENKLFKIFKQRMLNYYLPKQNNEVGIEELLNEYIKKYGYDTPNEYNDWLPKSIVDIIFSEKNNIENSKFIEQFKSINDPEIFMKPIFNRELIDEPLWKVMNDKIGGNEKLIKFELLLNAFFKWLNLINFNWNKVNFKISGDMQYVNVIHEIVTNNENTKNSNSLNKILIAIKNKYNNQDIVDSYQEFFLEFIINNKLINIIGATTTSKNEIKISSHDINLYSEYPVDYMIIDEISKCSMPEIFYRAILAKKIIFAGDYLQLPPSPNLDGENVINYLIDSKYKSEFHTEEDSIKEFNVQAKYRNWISDLYKKSFFTIQTKNIKNNNNNLYEFLNEAHRFGGNILSIVNKIYPSDEQLVLPYNINKINVKYNLIIGNINYNNEVVMVNLKKCSQKFLNTHHDFKQLDHIFGFDQAGSSYEYNGKLKKINNDGAYNQYSAFVICNIIEKLLENNDLKNFKIAIITLTRNQKEMVNFYIKSMNIKTNNIVVNTIDNFQGREEEIVIVDFIRGKTRIQNASKIINGKRNIDFLNQKERINVALSRAKQKLIMVGYFEYLRELDIEGRLFQKYYEELCTKYNGSSNSYIEWGYENDKN